jgi:arylsulfatase A-like enzyme
MPIRMTLPSLVVGMLLALQGVAWAQSKPQRNVILFVPDGLRALSVTPDIAPTLSAIRSAGVNFKNSHSVFPTFTTANASAMATGHQLGDTGDFSNTIYAGIPIAAAHGNVTPFLENDAVLGEMDQHFGGDYLNEETLLKAARAKGYSTAAMGKLGPTLIFDHTERTGTHTIIFDDATGSPQGIPLSDEIKAALTAAGLAAKTTPRGDNAKVGNATTPGTTVSNAQQQNYFADVATKVVLPLFKQRGKPFMLVYWSRDPDGSQHDEGDSLNKLVPGINGPTSKAGIHNADDNLRRLRAALDTLGLADTTDIIVSADHGFATISKQSRTSPSARVDFPDVPKGFLPPGFVALDLAQALKLPLFDPGQGNKRIEAGAHPLGSGLIGSSAEHPDLVVAANGGSDLLYLPNKDRALARRVVKALMAQDYVSGIFVDDSLGEIAGTLPLSLVNLKGKAATPRPSIVVNFRSDATGCEQPVLCVATVSDTRLQQGQGMHGSFSRGETMNFMAAIGPSFRRGYVDAAPVSNADVGRTIAHLLGLDIASKGTLAGRVMREAMPGGKPPRFVRRAKRSEPGTRGLRTVLNFQTVGGVRYLDAAGFPGRTVGLGVPTRPRQR